MTAQETQETKLLSAAELLSKANLPAELQPKPSKGRNDHIGDALFDLTKILNEAGVAPTKDELRIAYHNQHSQLLKDTTAAAQLKNLVEDNRLVKTASSEGKRCAQYSLPEHAEKFPKVEAAPVAEAAADAPKGKPTAK